MPLEFVGHLQIDGLKPNHSIDALKYQAKGPTPFIENSYYAGSLEFYTYIRNCLLYYFPDMELTADEKLVHKIHEQECFILNCAAVNLSKVSPRYDDEKLTDANNLVNGFFEQTGNICSILKHQRFNEGRGVDNLILCHPIDQTHLDTFYTQHNPKIKSSFFAFLWHKDVITEKQLYQSNAMLGIQHQQILGYKVGFDNGTDLIL